MEIKDFVAKFAAQFEDTDVSAFTPETIFRDVEEWSSLVALSVIAMIDEEYDVALRGDDIRSSKSIQDLFDRVSAAQ